MAIENGSKGEPIEAVGSNDDVVLHLLAGALQAGRTPPDAGHTSQRGRRIDGDSRAALAPEREVVGLVGGLEGGMGGDSG